ncbi:MAG: DUF4006 family protein [Oscillospiraceae bacterium]|nr:DUF4006 family protein [Oscillospiraceae bacterium]
MRKRIKRVAAGLVMVFLFFSLVAFISPQQAEATNPYGHRPPYFFRGRLMPASVNSPFNWRFHIHNLPQGGMLF